jgi:hypothetical protein
MRRAVAVISLVLFLAVADAAPRPRGRFAAYIDPTLVQPRPPKSPQVSAPRVSAEFVLNCVGATSTWLAAMRHRLARVLGERVFASIATYVVVDCASGNEPVLEPQPCEASLVTITPARPDDVVIDLRCGAPTMEEVTAVIRSRLGRRR